ncbi:MAG: D-sedoheptulose 7-phosphate isomerase [Rhodospirillales bacterium]|nr:D-sedoheptulose 7-phosphate isomerase [Rhodospirillales bacterium]
MKSFWEHETDEHRETLRKTQAALFPEFEKCLEACVTAVQNGGKILFFGNGGSAADSQHLATELSIRYIADRPSIPAIALTTDTSALTACANDMGFDHMFARQLEATGKEGDVAIGISTSGKSPNILKALETARNMGIVTVGLSGKSGGQMHELCDVFILVPSDTTSRIQEMHILIGHMLCGALEKKLGLV